MGWAVELAGPRCGHANDTRTGLRGLDGCLSSVSQLARLSAGCSLLGGHTELP